MTGLEPKNDASGQGAPCSDSAASKPGKSDYPVGYCKPPVHRRWQPGESGNRKGRPKGRPNLKTEVKEIAAKKITFRDGETTHKVSMIAANILAHAVKGAKGDVRSAGLFFNMTQKMGLLDDDDSIIVNDPALGGPTSGITTVSSAVAPSELLFANLDLNLLTREDMAELSRLAEVIDLGGDFTALSTADFERAKNIINKGRGKNVTPQ